MLELAPDEHEALFSGAEHGRGRCAVGRPLTRAVAFVALVGSALALAMNTRLLARRSGAGLRQVDLQGLQVKCGEFVDPYMGKVAARDAPGIAATFLPDGTLTTRVQGQEATVTGPGGVGPGISSFFASMEAAGCSQPAKLAAVDAQHFLAIDFGCAGTFTACMFIDFDVSSTETYWKVKHMSLDGDAGCQGKAQDPLTT